MNELNHLAIIMDGNGRWAKRRGLLRTKGHETGANVVEQMCEFCIDEGVAVLSLYAFSTENWKRPKSEVAFLMDLLHKFLLSKRESFIKNGIKFNVIGDESPLSDKLKNEIADIKNATAQNSRLKLNLALNYGAKDEILRAFRRFCEKSGGEFDAQKLALNLSASTSTRPSIFSCAPAASRGCQILCSGRLHTPSLPLRPRFGLILRARS